MKCKLLGKKVAKTNIDVEFAELQFSKFFILEFIIAQINHFLCMQKFIYKIIEISININI